MTIALPKARHGLAAIEQKLTRQVLDSWLSAIKGSARVALSLPRFAIRPKRSIDLRKALSALGMTLPFERLKADFTGMANPANSEDRLHIGHVFHQATVEVNEAGTEATAATAVAMMPTGAVPERPVIFRADHPFLFIIHTRTNPTMLFIGRLVDPRPLTSRSDPAR